MSRPYSVNGLNQYTSAGPATFTYDANGNLTSDGSTNFVYDAENRLVSASGAKTASLAYDPLGRLWQTSGGSAGVTRFLYDGDRLIMEHDAAGTRLRTYVHGAGADEPLIWYEMTGGAVRRFLHADHQGSIVAMADESGNPIAINAYDAWGIPNATNLGRFQYTGQAWIPELGMYYYKARIYSPTLGRFLQTDPVGYDDQLNLYAYVGNDPVNFVDPTGRQRDYDDEPLTQRLINQAVAAKEQIEGAKDAASAVADVPGNMAQDAATEAIPDSVYQTDRERQGIDGDYSLYPDYPNLPDVKKVINAGILHAVERGIQHEVFEDSASARSAYSELKSEITQARAWPTGTIYDRDGGGQIRPNSVLVPVGNNGYAVYRVRSNGTANLRTTLIRRP